jgi:hypothetical protein
MTHGAAQNSFDFDRATFDLAEGERRKEQGMALASAPLSRKQLLEIARLVAVRIARQQGWVTSDDVFYALLREGFDPTALGPAAGCVFRDKCFVFTGEWRKSARVSNHASDLRVWKLNDDYIPPKKGVMRELNPHSGERNVTECGAAGRGLARHDTARQARRRMAGGARSG